MSFRNNSIDEVIILEGLTKIELSKRIKEISDKNIVIDLQYAVTTEKTYLPFRHHVILLIQRKK